MNFHNTTVNVLPCHIQATEAENIDLWKLSNTRTNKQPIISSPQGAVEEDAFYAVYPEKKIAGHISHPDTSSDLHISYFRGRKLFGEPLKLPESSIWVYEKDQQQMLNRKGEVDEIIVWEHEKLPCDSAKVEGGFQNQWHDIPEMISLASIIHE